MIIFCLKKISTLINARVMQIKENLDINRKFFRLLDLKQRKFIIKCQQLKQLVCNSVIIFPIVTGISILKSIFISKQR